jgi:tRNA-2-methylthio-N6-dimethylallyladenosine synthase
MTKKKLYIKTYGCQMNVYDSVKMQELLSPHGFEVSDTQEGADLVILNTCHIREKAAEKVYSKLGQIRREKEIQKARGKKMIITVAGCVAQAEGEQIFKRAPFVDIVVGPQSYQNLPQLIEETKRKQGWNIDLDFYSEDKFDDMPQDNNSQGVSAFLSVQEGCDKFCHFCVVPYTRGAEFSRPVNKIYREALQLVSQGSREITLLGQNVSGYHGEGPEGKVWSLGKLIKHLAKIDGLERIRYMTSHPIDMLDSDLIEAHANEAKLMPYLHLPVQSGSNRILKAMNRKHDRELYFKIIEEFQKARPDIAFSSDFIVGYPGETEADFMDTMDLANKVKYTQCYSFKYSIRPGTPAGTLAGQIDEEVKSERLNRLQDKLRSKQEGFNKSCIGMSLPVLFDRKAKQEELIAGKSPYMQTVLVEDNGQIAGEIADVEILEAGLQTLRGKLI